MNIKLKALLYTIGVLASIFSGAFVVVAIANFFSTDATLIFTCLLGLFLIWTIYELMLSKIKMDESIQESIEAMQKRIDDRLK
jgi:CHASE1-domain containing sensor protein